MPELHIRERRPIPTRTGTPWRRISGAVLCRAAAGRPAGHPAGDCARPVSRSRFGALLASITHSERLVSVYYYYYIYVYHMLYGRVCNLL